MDGLIVGCVTKALAKPCQIMMETVDVLSSQLRVSFVKLNGTEVNESNGKQYWEDQPEIWIEYMSDHISNNKRRERLANISKKWTGIDLIEVEEEAEEDLGEATEKDGDHVGEDVEDPLNGPNRKRLKSEMEF